jgi:O-antigen/teichoic acid export membrane protein
MLNKLIFLFPQKSFLRNFSVLISSNILISLLGMFTSVYIARVFSPEIYGKYGVLISLSSIISVFSGLGLTTTVIRNVSRDQINSSFYLYSSAIANLLGFILVLFIFLACNQWNLIRIEDQYLVLVFISIFCSSAWNLLQNIAFGMQRVEHVSLINLTATLLLFIIYIVIPKEYITLFYVFGISILVQIVKDIMFFLSLRHSGLLKFSRLFSMKELFNSSIVLIKMSTPFLVMGFFSMLSNQMPIQFLYMNSGVDQVAFFNTANKLLLPISLVITTAMTAIFPDLSRLFITDKSTYIKIIRNGFQLLIYFGTFSAILVTLFRHEIVILVYGEKYLSTALVLTYQVWFMVVFSIFNFIGSILSSSDNQKVLSYLSILYAIVSVSILWFGSMRGAEFISLSFLLSSLINLTYHWYFMEKSLDWPFDNTYRFKLIAVLFIPGILLSFLPVTTSFEIRLSFSLIIIGLILYFNVKNLKYYIKLKFNL